MALNCGTEGVAAGAGAEDGGGGGGGGARALDWILDTGRLAAGAGAERGAERVAAGFLAAVFRVLVEVNRGFVAQGGKDSVIQQYALMPCQQCLIHILFDLRLLAGSPEGTFTTWLL